MVRATGSHAHMLATSPNGMAKSCKVRGPSGVGTLAAASSQVFEPYWHRLQRHRALLCSSLTGIEPFCREVFIPQFEALPLRRKMRSQLDGANDVAQPLVRHTLFWGRGAVYPRCRKVVHAPDFSTPLALLHAPTVADRESEG